MDKDKKKSEVRESKPLAESPKYDSDASTLVDNLRKIQADSAARRATAYTERKAKSDKRRESMNSKGRQAGGGLQGLNTSLGGKIVN
jgi:hypothetical protein